MKVSKTSLSFFVFVSLFCLFLSPAISVAKIYHLTILHTSDHHGHFAKFSLPGNPDVGGMAARSTLINIVRAEVEEYAQYLRGEVYGFRWEVEEAEVCECCDNVDWNTVDEESCWGFFGWPSEYMIPDEINPSLAEYGVQVSN